MMLRQLHHPEISEWAERVFTLMQKSHDANFRLQIGYYLAIYYFWTGNFAKMHIVVNSLHKDIQSEAASPLLSLFGRATESMYAFIFGSIAKGKEYGSSDIDLLLIGEVDQDFLVEKISKFSLASASDPPKILFRTGTPTTAVFSFGKKLAAEGKATPILLAKRAENLLTFPGIASDSWMIRGILKRAAAIMAGSAP